MGLDVKKNPFLYSVGTQLAYKIAKRYYKNIHYAWCTTEFNSSNNRRLQIRQQYVKVFRANYNRRSPHERNRE